MTNHSSGDPQQVGQAAPPEAAPVAAAEGRPRPGSGSGRQEHGETDLPTGPGGRSGWTTLVRRDFERLRAVKGRGFWWALLDAVLLDAGFQALLAYRLGSALRRAGVPVLPALLRRWAVGACAVDLLPAAEIGGGCIVAHGVGLVVGGETVIGEDCTLLHGVTLGEVRFDELACPRLGDRVTVGVGAIVLGGITVGDDAMIGAGAVVRRDVPAGARVAGVPARVIGWEPGYGPAQHEAGSPIRPSASKPEPITSDPPAPEDDPP